MIENLAYATDSQMKAIDAKIEEIETNVLHYSTDASDDLQLALHATALPDDEDIDEEDEEEDEEDEGVF